ncbi:flagellar assembly protein FliX [Zavarzinia sp. CC-PAN008]|uniref:flagellar assembly protein FliX n=1 Tax=Zavarzinia sp. CC-PAN008 TaxID=3243332 RepID=UPI003F748DCA
MKVEGPGRVAGPQPNRKAGKAADGDKFTIEQQADEPATAGVTGARAPVGLNALIGLQEVPDPRTRRARTLREADDLLDRLEELRHGLLLGHIPQERLQQLLATISRRREAIDDPRLAELMDDIVLRASVELAKLGIG